MATDARASANCVFLASKHSRARARGDAERAAEILHRRGESLAREHARSRAHGAERLLAVVCVLETKRKEARARGQNHVKRLQAAGGGDSQF